MVSNNNNSNSGMAKQIWQNVHVVNIFTRWQHSVIGQYQKYIHQVTAQCNRPVPQYFMYKHLLKGQLCLHVVLACSLMFVWFLLPSIWDSVIVEANPYTKWQCDHSSHFATTLHPPDQPPTDQRHQQYLHVCIAACK